MDGLRRARIRSAWVRWWMLCVPTMAVSGLATLWLEVSLVVAGLLAILSGTLLFQRHVRHRGWTSILWGVHAFSDRRDP